MSFKKILEAAGESQCTYCKRIKHKSEFYPDPRRSNGVRARCKECSVLTGNRGARQKKTGWTPEEYTEQFSKQNGQCAICGKPQSLSKVALAADHNHLTGQKRGLLCSSCNILIGIALEDIGILLSAARYVQRWNDEAGRD